MALRCFLFSSDEGTVANLRQILDGLGVDAEPCSDAVKAAEKITNQPFQMVIIDWDQQPEAGVLLNTARERKASERPLTLALVSNDASAPQALQAGANSLLRKPIVMTQAKETLTTARDLLRAKQGSANAQAAAAAASPAVPGATATLRAGEFLQTPSLAPSAQFETDMPVMPPSVQSSDGVSPLKDLEPMAAAVSPEPIPQAAAPEPSAPFPGLQSISKSRSMSPTAPTLPSPSAPRGNPEMAGYHEKPSFSAAPPPPAPKVVEKTVESPARRESRAAQETQQEAQLFSYLTGELEEEKKIKASGSGLKMRAIIAASALAACAILAAPQAPWHPKIQGLWNSGRRAVHVWLYPQPVTPVQAPASHENFARAGDEYKLPVAEAIPDSTTDPSQIRVVPVIDPTKKPSADQGDPSAPPDTSPIDTPAQSPADQPAAETPANQAPAGQTNVPPATVPAPNVLAAPVAAQPGASQPASIAVVSPAPVSPPHADNPVPASSTPVTAPPKKYPEPRAPTMPGYVPPSLRSQLAPPSVTDAGTSKALTTVLPSIEPVPVTESAERALLIEQPAPVYPPNAKGQQGSVTLQLLIGRNGTVQDAKFVQGSFLFARSAIDAVRQWKFKPYIMNGNPVSVQAPLTLKFSPAQ